MVHDKKSGRSTLVGLVSHAFNGQCNANEFTTFARVDFFVDWIEKKSRGEVFYSTKFECRNGNEIGFWKKCDGHDNCGDNSDEENCVRGKIKEKTFELDKNSTIDGENFTLMTKRSEEIKNLKLHNDRNSKFLPTRVAEVFPKLENFQFSTCKVWKIFRINFASLIHLKVLNLKNNVIREIEKSSFYELGSLEELNLSDNKLEALDEGVFRALGNLRKIDLKSNDISHLQNLIFNRLSKLEVLNLNSNKLTNIQAQIFSMNEKLEEIFLFGNQIASIHGETFKGLKNLKIVDLRRNRCINKKFSPVDETKLTEETQTCRN